MHVIMVVFWLGGGGAERVASILANKLAEDPKNKIKLLLYSDQKNDYSVTDDVDVCYIPKFNGNRFIKKIKTLKFIRSQVKTFESPTVIPFLTQPMIDTFLSTRFLKCLFVSTVRNNPKTYPNSIVLRKISNFIYNHSTKVMLQTNEQRKYFSKIKDNNFFTVPNPVKDEFLSTEFKYRGQVKVIAACGRLNEQKNYPLLFDAFSDVIKRTGRDIILKIYGCGSLENELEKYIDRIGMKGKILLMGRTRYVKKALLESDVYVLSSDYEGMPNSLMEAMAVGLPCISTSCETGPADLIQNNIDGFLVPVGDKDVLSKQLEYCIRNYNECIDVGKRAHKKMIRNYTVDESVRKFIEGLTTVTNVKHQYSEKHNDK